MTEELKELLGEDGSRVCKEVEKALQGGNARAKSAGSVGAAILAVHAATWAERVSRATGKPFTAQDYMKSVMIEVDGTVRDGALNALRAGIDLDERVKVVDISAAMPKKSMDAKAVKRFLQGLIRDNPLAITADGTAVVSILSNKDVEHITYSSRKNLPADIYRIRRKSILSIEELLENAVLIESIPNRKIKKKPYARAYHRFYVPVRMNQHLATIRIVAEERQGVITLNPTDVNLYDLIVEDKKRRANAPAGSLPLGGPDSSSDTITIREMLAGVKDADGEPCCQRAWHGAAKKMPHSPSITSARAMEVPLMPTDCISQKSVPLPKAIAAKTGRFSKWRFPMTSTS